MSLMTSCYTKRLINRSYLTTLMNSWSNFKYRRKYIIT